MEKEITASTRELMRQAPGTANNYFLDAVICIDKKFGVGYAQQHPELIGAFMNCCATDFLTAVLGKKLENVVESMESVSESVFAISEELKNVR